MGGDAAAVVRDRLKPKSVSHAFINFPEPPSGYLGYEASNSLHLLTPQFFIDLHRVLTPGGRLTIFSDNHRYCCSLARLLGEMRRGAAAAGAAGRCFASVPLDGRSCEWVDGIRNFRGVP